MTPFVLGIRYEAIVCRTRKVCTTFPNLATSFHVRGTTFVFGVFLATRGIDARSMLRIWNEQLAYWTCHHLASLSSFAAEVMVRICAFVALARYVFCMVSGHLVVWTLERGTHLVCRTTRVVVCIAAIKARAMDLGGVVLVGEALRAFIVGARACLTAAKRLIFSGRARKIFAKERLCIQLGYQWRGAYKIVTCCHCFTALILITFQTLPGICVLSASKFRCVGTMNTTTEASVRIAPA